MARLVCTLVAGFVAFAQVGPGSVHAAQDPLKQQQMEYAKQQFAEAEQLLAEGKAAEAVEKYEIAYRYAPEFHALNYNIGVAAMAAGDCVKARLAFQRFLDLVPEHEMRGDAQEQLLEIERSGCAATPQAGGQAAGPVTDDEEAPELTSRRQQREEATAAEDAAAGTEDKPRRKAPMVTAGIGLMAAGGGLLLSGGIAGLISVVNAKKLKDLSKAGPTGFSPASYADDKVFKMDVNRKNGMIAGAVLGGVGVVALATGIALFVVGKKKQKKEQGGAAEGASQARLRLDGVGAAVGPGGGGVTATVRF